MASTRISYQDQTGLGFEIADFVNAVEVALAKGRRLLPKINAATNGNDWHALALELGVGTTDQNAQDLWTLISTAKSAIDCPAVAELARLDRR